MKTRVVVLGAGFGGLELCTVLSDELGEDVVVTLIDRNDSFILGYSKLDVMFGRAAPEAVRMHYSEVDKPGVRFLQETVTAIDPEARVVTTDAGIHEADHLIVALGAEYDMDATPGLAEGGNEFYSLAGAEELAGILPTFSAGRALIGVCGAPVKCPPAPSETCLLLDDYLTGRGVRDACEITFVTPLSTPVPASKETSVALIDAFAERDIEFIPQHRVAAIDQGRSTAILDDGHELPFDLFLGVPKHRAPEAVLASGLTEDGYVPVDPRTLRTKFENVYAVGDVATLGVPKSGVFAEGAARAVAASVIASIRGAEQPAGFAGGGSCYIEFGSGLVGRVDVSFRGGSGMSSAFHTPSEALVAEKVEFGSSRRARWF